MSEAALLVFPLDGGRVALLYGSAPALVVAADVARALSTLDATRSVEEHERAARGAARDPAIADAAVAVIRQLAAMGQLTAPGELRGDERTEPDVTLGHVAVLTRDRTARLARCVESYLLDQQAFGRSVPVVVVDDSADPDVRHANREALRAVQRRLGGSIAYAGLEEKVAFVQNLAAAGIDPWVASFALLDPLGVGCTIGANRNALFLACPSEAFLCADDDTMARVAAPPTAAPGIALATQRDPTHFWFFESRDRAVDGAPALRESALALHERVLGQRTAALLARATERGEPVDVSDVDARSAAAARRGDGRALVSTFGVLGDSGMHSSAVVFSYWAAPGRPSQTEHDYRLSSSSREVLRAVPRLTLARGTALAATTLAFDHRRCLPPFLPVLRNEDGVYAATLAQCFEADWVAHLPRVILHDAEPRAGYVPDRIAVAGAVRLSDFLAGAIRSFGMGQGIGDGPSRMRRLGEHLADVGRASPSDFRAAVRKRLLAAASARAQRYEGWLRQRASASEAWASEIRAHLRTQRQALVDDAYDVPSDLAPTRTVEEATALARHVVRSFGSLLRDWPDVVAAARSLQDQGIGLALPL